MSTENPYAPPAHPTVVEVTQLNKVSVAFAQLGGGIALAGLLVRYGYPALTGPIWYFALAPSLAVIAMISAQIAIASRSESRTLKSGLPFIVSTALYVSITVPFAKSPMIYFDLIRHFSATAAGATLITGLILVTRGSTKGFRWLIVAFILTIFFSTTTLGDLLSFVLSTSTSTVN